MKKKKGPASKADFFMQNVTHHSSLEAFMGAEADFIIGLVLFHGSWNKLKNDEVNLFLSRAMELTINNQGFKDSASIAYGLRIDQTVSSLACCIGETAKRFKFMPAELPTFAIIFSKKSMEKDSEVEFHPVTSIRPCDILRYFKVEKFKCDLSFFARTLLRPIRAKVDELEILHSLTFDEWICSKNALRIFIAGDRSSVGKSSVCLGILGSLLEIGYSPDSLAYIKPATQSESTQLIQLFCEQRGIHCVPIGPLVYYRGFTRAFLAKETETTAVLLQHCALAVDRIARGKRIVLVDGVGFPAVGSICGTSNATMAHACGYPTETRWRRKPMGVVLVCGSGVGAAVDAFNLNSTYFEQAHVPVMGSLFNKLSETGFYSLENCKAQVTTYFDRDIQQIMKDRDLFGFVPLFPRIAGKYALDHVNDYIQMFRSHVNVDAIVEGARRFKKAKYISESTVELPFERPDGPIQKQRKLSATRREPITIRSRQEIEAEAISSGAAPSA